MMGIQAAAAQLFYDFCLDDHVPADHLFRGIQRHLDLDGVRKALKPFYSNMGRPSVDPDVDFAFNGEWKESGLQAARRRSTAALSRPSNTAARTVATQCAPRGDHRIRCFLAMRALTISSTQPSAREVEIRSLER
jgi:hypothetical protein